MTTPRRDPEGADLETEWLVGWDDTQGIVSVWAEPQGTADVWRRLLATGELVREEVQYRPWVLLDRLDDLAHLGPRLVEEGASTEPAAAERPATFPMTPQRDTPGPVTFRELGGPGELRYLVSGPDLRELAAAVLTGAAARLGRVVPRLRDLGPRHVLVLPPEEQYLVASGRTYFRGLTFDDLHRLQFDLETTGFDARYDRIFMVAIRLPDGATEVLEVSGRGDRAEAELIRRLVEVVTAADPDVIENHNLHGFDLPFLARRARRLGVPLGLGRLPDLGLRERGARRGEERDGGRVRFVAPGRELIDTIDAVQRYDFATRELPGHGLKAVARHLGLAAPDRVYIPGREIFATWQRDPEPVRRYAAGDVQEVAGIARLLGGAAFALARMAPRRYERLSDAGPATGVIDPILVRAYLRAGAALPAHQASDGTPHSGAALHLFATGVAYRVVKADVASLYPSLMRQYRIGPARDHLGVLLALVDRLVEQRLAAKSAARSAPSGSAERHEHEATSGAMKLVVNSAYGYLAAGGELTRFADVHAANEVTRRGRETLSLICRELAARGVTLLEADTDGVYFAVPADWPEDAERRVVEEVAALLPPLVHLELEGRYAAMLSHEPKNYALLGYDGTLTLRGVAFRSSRAEPFGERFLRNALRRLFTGDLPGIRDAYLEVLDRLRRRELPTLEVSTRARLTKTPEQYLQTRPQRREAAYEALLASGRSSWRRGERVRIYRTEAGGWGLVAHDDEPDPRATDPRDYDASHYGRLLRANFASRLARAFTAEDFAALFAEPDQLSLFATPLERIEPVLRIHPSSSAGSPTGTIHPTWL